MEEIITDRKTMSIGAINSEKPGPRSPEDIPQIIALIVSLTLTSSIKAGSEYNKT